LNEDGTADRTRTAKLGGGDSDTDFALRQSSDAEEEEDSEAFENTIINSSELSAQKARSGGRGTKKNPLVQTPAKMDSTSKQAKSSPIAPKKATPKKIAEKATPRRVIKLLYNPRTPQKVSNQNSSSGPVSGSSGMKKNRALCPPNRRGKKAAASSGTSSSNLSKPPAPQKPAQKPASVKRTTVRVADLTKTAKSGPVKGTFSGKSPVLPMPKAIPDAKKIKPKTLSEPIVIDSDSELAEYQSAVEDL
jgi:hypothetical protein